MRRAGVIVVALGAFAQQALAQELRLVGGSDVFAATGGVADDAQIGVTVRGDVLDLARHLDVHLDFRDRIGLAGDVDGKLELFDLHATLRALAGGHLDLYFGRFGSPTGGLWLITDGAGVHARLTGGLAVDAFGGLRAFNTSLLELHLAANPSALGIAGASASFDRPGAHLDAAFVWAQDRFDYSPGYGGGDDAIVDSTVTSDYTLNADALLLPTPDVMLTGSVLLSSRYDLLIGQMGFANAPALDVATLAAFEAHAMAEWRPPGLGRRLRLAYLFDFNRVRVLESHQPLDFAQPAAAGSFEDHQLKASWRPVPSLPLRLDVRYRLRFRENTDVIHRVEAGLWGDALVAGFGVFATFGLDEYQSFHVVGKDPSQILWQAGLSYITPWLETRVGMLYTDANSTCAMQQTAFMQSSPTSPAPGTCPTPSALFPFLLESQRIAFVRAFGWWRGLFGGIDAEANMDLDQFRLMAQLGYAR